MLRRFSEELAEDREFEIGGELFKFRYPYWEEGAALFDEDLTPSENGDGGEFSFRADTEMAIKRIPMFLDPTNEAHARFKRLVARKTDAVPRHQIVQLYRWLVEVTSGLPTNPPSESVTGGGSNGTPSEEESSSPAETPEASVSETSSTPPTPSRGRPART